MNATYVFYAIVVKGRVADPIVFQLEVVHLILNQ